MSLGDRLRDAPTDSGVYAMVDIAGLPAYVGRSSNLRSRLRQHFIRQDSSVVSYGRLDVRDIATVAWWETDDDKVAEQALLFEYEPYLNFGEELTHPIETPIDVTHPDGVIQIRTDDERQQAGQPYVRAQRKLEHLKRLLDKVDFAAHTPETQQAIYAHLSILRTVIDDYLNTPATDPLEGNTRDTDLRTETNWRPNAEDDE